jgi:hypothetical protein
VDVFVGMPAVAEFYEQFRVGGTGSEHEHQKRIRKKGYIAPGKV